MHDIYKQYQKILGSDNLNTLKIKKKKIKYVLLIAIDYIKEIEHFFRRDTNITVKNFNDNSLLHHTINLDKPNILKVVIKKWCKYYLS